MPDHHKVILGKVGELLKSISEVSERLARVTCTLQIGKILYTWSQLEEKWAKTRAPLED